MERNIKKFELEKDESGFIGGIQLGGYWTETHIEMDGIDDCVNLIIHGDGQFPLSEDESKDFLSLHFCQFDDFIKRMIEYNELIKKVNYGMDIN